LNITLDNQKVLSTGALVLSILILLAALGMALWPLPSTAAQIQDLKKKTVAAMAAGKKANDSVAAQQQIAISQTWLGTGNEIGPTAYQNLNKIASGLNVKIESFRSGRLIDAGDVSQIPYVLIADGSFVSVVQFVHQIETTPTKLAVETLQIGSSDESSDQVTATIGLEAYVINPVADTSSKTTTGGTTTVKTPTVKTTVPKASNLNVPVANGATNKIQVAPKTPAGAAAPNGKPNK
jgi:Tfp pilus assembly protein PilO